MNQTATEQTLDVRTIPPRQRHPLIFKTWEELPSGAAMLLVNDHDPLPLYYQFACEHGGSFRWEYLETGPELWRVRLSKGDFPDPGFVPSRKAPLTQPATATAVSARVLDTRPIFASGDTPCAVIDEAVASLIPGQALVLLVPFEPVPLYAKLKKEGFTPEPRQLPDGSWRVEFRR